MAGGSECERPNYIQKDGQDGRQRGIFLHQDLIHWEARFIIISANAQFSRQKSMCFVCLRGPN